MLKDFIPAPDVQEFVQLYRIVHLKFEQGQPVPFKAYPPRPEQCLAFYPYDTETVEYKNTGKQVKNLPVVLYGQFSEVTHRMIGNNFLVFQIIFNPGALHRLTSIPSAEITNQYLDAETFFSAEIRTINEQLHYAANYKAMIDIADIFVRSLIKKQQKPRLLIDDACILLLKADKKFTLQQIAREACLSPKQLERKFKERTGVNPKLYERIIRFDKAFRLKNSNPKMDWLSIALECNYHDYQHLIKNYKDLTGLSPAAFHEMENNAPERKFGLSEGYYS
ncbi:helix-turn-helix domain-containing protein [Ferruginibacter sp.]|nr:AraC family transcriptional regulator [Ferruginibacter sp.]